MPRPSKTLRLTAGERRFFSLVAESVFANPFGDERDDILAEILGRRRVGLRSDELADFLQSEVARHLARLEGLGAAQVGAFDGEEGEVLRIAFLFDVYHSAFARFQEHIEEQIRAGDEPIAAPFAADVLASLRKRGFGPDEARRYFALLFQLRRAYHFIERGLTGGSASMKELRRQLWNSVITHDIRWYDDFLMDRMEEFSTLLLGETGTGKGTAAMAIGRAGLIPFDEKKGRFVESFTHAFTSINLSQFSELLIESELFGHRKGAFTGAIDDHAGVFARCSPHGSILLDEIGEVSGPVQIKLLEVLQERRFTPVGSRETQRFHGRVIGATNRAIDELHASGVFRDDFFYRLSSNIIVVPPLRQRLREEPGELDALLTHALRRMVGEGAERVRGRVREAIDRCLPPDYAWPGNVRELEQCVRRILLTNRYRPVAPAERGRVGHELLEKMEAGALSASELLAAYCALLYAKHGTLAEVARLTGLDRRTVKKYVAEAGESGRGS